MISALPGACPHEGSSGDSTALASALRLAVSALDGAGVQYLLIGGLASAILGRPRCSSDVDLFVAPECAPRALAALAGADFSTEITNATWLYKAFSQDILVDILFRTVGDIYLDREMLRRSQLYQFLGTRVRVVAPEDLIVIKALVHDEETPRHWHDALALLARHDLDWGYLLGRARHGPRRVLSLLLYAASNDRLVPSRVLRQLADQLLED